MYNNTSLPLNEETVLADIDWNLVAKVAGAGYGLTFLILIMLALCTWLTGAVIQRTGHTDTEDES